MVAVTPRPIARRLRDAVEPVAASVYFAPEAQAAYAELGLGPGPGYFCSRGACLGPVAGEVVAAAFAVFNPDIVVAALAEGWSHTDPATVLVARQRSASVSLSRLLIEAPRRATPPATAAAIARATDLLRRAGEAATAEGRPLYAGLRSLGWPGDPVGDLWRAADLIREHRGDSHTAAWVAAGVSAIDITVLSSAWVGQPVDRYIRTRGWSTAQVSASIDGLRTRRLLEGDRLTAEGLELRQAIEVATDRGEQALISALGADADEACDLLESWGAAIVAARAHPVDRSRPGQG